MSVREAALPLSPPALASDPPVLLLQLSPEVRDLLDRILVPKEEERITIPEIEAHPWYRTGSLRCPRPVPPSGAPRSAARPAVLLDALAATVSEHTLRCGANCMCSAGPQVPEVAAVAVRQCGAGAQGRPGQSGAVRQQPLHQHGAQPGAFMYLSRARTRQCHYSQCHRAHGQLLHMPAFIHCASCNYVLCIRCDDSC